MRGGGLMSSHKRKKKPLSPREAYFANQISAEEFTRKIIEFSDGGDRKRRTIEEKVEKLAHRTLG